MNDMHANWPRWQSVDMSPGQMLPLDLQNLAPGCTLIRWILELQPEGLNHWPVPVSLQERGPYPIQPPALFTLIVYCYSTGLFASSEIEARLEGDPHLKYICANCFPTESLIRRFRRDHQDAIVKGLAGVLQRAYVEFLRSNSGLSLAPPQSCSVTGTNPYANLKLSFLDEARSRYRHAVQLDSMALDV